MKNNEKGFLRPGIIAFVVVVACLALFYLAEKLFNGAYKDWFYNRFYVDVQNEIQGKLGVIFRSWSQIKVLIINGFLVLVLLLGLYTAILTYFYDRYRSKKDIALITRAVNSFMKSDNEGFMLPKKFFEVETKLARLKTELDKNQQLAQTEMQRKNDLITYLAHDLKTPLASVIGYLSLLDEASDMPAEQRSKYVGIALKKSFRLEELINEFFDITRFNLQSIVLNKSQIKLAFMLHQMADEFYPLLAPQGKTVKIDVPDGLLLMGDADKLARVFNNILKNAIAYSYENSTINIAGALQERKVVITFINHGDVIPPLKLETIFEKFYRLDTSRSAVTGGAGLGLAIAREIVEAHGGSITANSNREATVFTVKLPS